MGVRRQKWQVCLAAYQVSKHIEEFSGTFNRHLLYLSVPAHFSIFPCWFWTMHQAGHLQGTSQNARKILSTPNRSNEELKNQKACPKFCLLRWDDARPTKSERVPY